MLRLLQPARAAVPGLKRQQRRSVQAIAGLYADIDDIPVIDVLEGSGGNKFRHFWTISHAGVLGLARRAALAPRLYLSL